MKSKFAAFAMLFVAVFTLGSCLNSDDDFVYTDDSAITSFSVTTVKQYIHILSSTGADSVYTSTTSLTGYRFSIDQNNNIIFNIDSLPYGVDATKILCSVSASNSGTVLIKSKTSDTLSYVSSTDSIDFSVPRQLQVVSNSGKALRKYTVTVNVHKEAADSFKWHEMAVSAVLQNLSTVKTVAVSAADGTQRVMLFGSDGNHTYIYTYKDAEGWKVASTNLNHQLDANVCNSVVTKNDSVYISENGNILRSADGSQWESVANATPAVRLVAASPVRLYAYSADAQLLASADCGHTWAAATIDTDASFLPSGETTYTCTQLSTNADSYRVTLIGTRADGTMAVWGKIDEAAANSENQPWAYYEVSADNRHALPTLSGISVAAYDGSLFVLGTPDASSAAQLYASRDGGITWAADTLLGMPTGFNLSLQASPATAKTLTVDGKNFLWMVNATTGATWRGRINRLGWEKKQFNFE